MGDERRPDLIADSAERFSFRRGLEIQKYLFKVGPVGLVDGSLLSDIVDFFEQGAADGKGVTELIGTDVAAFADDLIEDSPTYADIYQESVNKKPGTAED